MTTDKAMTPEAPMDSPPMSAPMTPEEVREARRQIDAALKQKPDGYARVLHEDDFMKWARYARVLERHAEAMAEAIGSAKAMDVPRDIAMAFAEYRTQFPRTDEDGR
jgi:hypothetical protein